MNRRVLVQTLFRTEVNDDGGLSRLNREVYHQETTIFSRRFGWSAMPGRLFAHFLPVLLHPDELRDATAVVIDLLRASTTICHALAAGAREVIPCLEVDDARRIAADLAASTPVLGGERDGVQIEGFDLGNSPEEYQPDTVGGR